MQYNFRFSFRKCSFQHHDYHFMEIRKPCTYISSVLKTIATVSYEKINTTWIIHADSINSDLQRGLDRRLRHIQH